MSPKQGFVAFVNKAGNAVAAIDAVRLRARGTVRREAVNRVALAVLHTTVAQNSNERRLAASNERV